MLASQIKIGSEYRLNRERLPAIVVKVIDYRVGHWVSYHGEANQGVTGSCTPDFFLENATPL